MPALDGLRGIAVLLVIVFHTFQGDLLPGRPLPRFLYLATRVGGSGVELFFVISGFLITGILYDARRDRHYFRNFYARRTLRIFPLYYAVLTAAFVALPLALGGVASRVMPESYGVASANQAWLWCYGANLAHLFGNQLGCFDHFWTLSIEEQFYLIWPLVVLSLRRETLIWICAACLVAAALFRLALLPSGSVYNRLTVCQMDGLALGSLLALAARGPRGVRDWSKAASLAVVPFIILIGLLYIRTTATRNMAIQVVKPSLLAILFGLVLALAVTSSETTALGKFFTLRPLRKIGRYSYAMYVFHPFIILGAAGAFAALGYDPSRGSIGMMLVKAPIVLAITMLTSYLSWIALEVHFLKLKNYFNYDQRGLPDVAEHPTQSAAS